MLVMVVMVFSGVDVSNVRGGVQCRWRVASRLRILEVGSATVVVEVAVVVERCVCVEPSSSSW